MSLPFVTMMANVILSSRIVTWSKHVRYVHYTATNNRWKILFFGTDDFAVESLKILHSSMPKLLSKLEVVTAANNSETVQYSNQHGIFINKWPLKCTTPHDYDIGVVVSFGHLISKDVINSFPLGMINVHGSLLPRWRGSCPINYALIKGDTETGVTIMKIMPEKFDTGDIILQQKIKIGPDDTLVELRSRLAKCGANLLLETIEKLPHILECAKPQDSSNATYAYKIKPELSIIKWDKMSANDIYNLKRGLPDSFGLRATFEDKRIKLSEVSLYDNVSFTEPHKDDTPGTVMYDRKRKVLIVKCRSNSWIAVNKVIVGNKQITSAASFSATYLSGKQKKKLLFL